MSIPTTTATPIGAVRGKVWFLVFLVGAVLVILREPSTVAFNHLWAEDGRIFLTEEVRRGTFTALGIAYQGYGDLVPRLAAAAVSVLPIGWWPAGVTVIAALVEGACAALVFCSSAHYIRTPWIRGVLALLVVCVPAARVETTGAISDLQWPLLFTMFWLCWWTPSRRQLPLLAIAGLAVAGTSPVAVLYLPLLAIRFVRNDDQASRHSVITLGAGAALGLMYQAALVLASHRLVNPSLGEIPNSVFVQGFAGALIGAHSQAYQVHKLLIAAAAVAILALLAVIVLGLLDAERRVLTVALVLYVGAFAVAESVFSLYGGWHPRYGVVPSLLVYSLVAVVGDSVIVRRGPTAAGVVTTVVAVWILVATVVQFPADALRDQGASWSAGVAHARSVCAEHIEAKHPHVVHIPTGPYGYYPGFGTWYVSVPCKRL
jgi:hypothetical protein